MAIKLSMQQAGQKAHNVALSGISNETIIQATPGSRYAIQSQAGDIRTMTRQGDKLIINSADGKIIEVDHFFGPASKDMKSLTIDDGSAGEKKYILGDEKIYHDGEPVTSYTPEQLRQVVSGEDYYAQQAVEAHTAGGSDIDPMWIALGLGGVALVAGTIALINDDDDDDNDHDDNGSNDNGGNDDNGGNNGGNDDNGGDNAVTASSITMDKCNGTSLHGTTDVANATVMIDTNGDGQPDYTVQSDANCAWSVPVCNPPLADQQTVTAWVVDANGNKIDTSIVVDFHAPDLVSLDVADDLSGLSGVTEAGSTVSLDLDGDGVAEYTIKADSAGKYSFSLQDTQQLVPGTSILTITDVVGNTTTLTLPSTTAPTIFGISDTPDGTIAMTNTTDSTSPTLHGMGEPGSEIDILSNGAVVATTTVGEDGNWQVTLDNLPLGENTFAVTTSVTAQATDSTDAQGRSVNITYSTGEEINEVSASDLLHTVETDNGQNTTQTITRALPDGGYLIAWAQPESAGSEYYDIKMNIYDAQGNVVNTLTVGQENTMDGYTTIDGLQGLNNFDVAVSPVDGSITVFYTQGTPGDLDYTGTSAVYERFSADGVELTDGPQMVASTEELGGLGGLLDAIIGQNLSDMITSVIDMVWSPIETLLQPFASIINVDLDGLEDLFVNELSNRIASVFYGSGTFGANAIQMDDGSVVFVGTRYSECLDSATLIDRLDIDGFLTDFFTDIGLINQGNFISDLVEPLFNAFLDIIADPIENIVDDVLEWADINLGSDGSLVWSVEFTPDANGNLVQSTDFEYAQMRDLFSGINENGFISGGDHNGIINKMAQWVFGTNGDDVGASVGLDGTQVSDSTYAVIWQRIGNNAELSGSEQPKVMLTLVDAKTGEHITNDVTLSETGLAPKIVTLSDGSLVATWVNVNDLDSGDIYSQHLSVVDGKFVPLSDAVMVNTITDGTQGLAEGTFKETYDVAALNNGGYIVTWTSTTSDGKEHLEAQAYDMTGVKIGDETTIDSGMGNEINDSSITALSDGGYVVNWSETNEAEGTSTVMYRVFNDDGSLRASGEESPTDQGSQYALAADATSFTGSEGADVVDAHLAHAAINGGGGDDRILVDAGIVQSVDGGAGGDTVVFTNAGEIGSDALLKLHNVETLDLNASNEANTLKLSYDDVLKVSADDKLFINGGANDSVDLDQDKWTMTATGNKDGQSYNLYTYDDDHHTQVWIQHNVQVI